MTSTNPKSTVQILAATATAAAAEEKAREPAYDRNRGRNGKLSAGSNVEQVAAHDLSKNPPSKTPSMEEEEEEGGVKRGRGGGWEVLSDFKRDFMAAAVMGGAAHTVVAPVERAKLLLQTQESNAAIVGEIGAMARRRRFKGMVDCIVRMVREEGVLSLWRGNGTSVIRYYPTVALNFSFKDLYRTMLRSGGTSGDSNLISGTAANFIAGSTAGCTTLVIVYPLDIAHTRIAADLGKTDSRQFKGIYHFLHTIYMKDGARGIYRGLPASFHGIIVHRGLYFGGFDTAKEYLTLQDPKLPLWKRWFVGQAITTSAGLISYPLDTVRRRMMMQSGMDERMYSSTLDCWKKIYRMEGFASFYRGAVSGMFRSTGSAAVLVLYDEVKRFMNRERW